MSRPLRVRGGEASSDGFTGNNAALLPTTTKNPHTTVAHLLEIVWIVKMFLKLSKILISVVTNDVHLISKGRINIFVTCSLFCDYVSYSDRLERFVTLTSNLNYWVTKGKVCFYEPRTFLILNIYILILFPLGFRQIINPSKSHMINLSYEIISKWVLYKIHS